jgi:hypothetical protein
MENPNQYGLLVTSRDDPLWYLVRCIRNSLLFALTIEHDQITYNSIIKTNPCEHYHLFCRMKDDDVFIDMNLSEIVSFDTENQNQESFIVYDNIRKLLNYEHTDITRLDKMRISFITPQRYRNIRKCFDIHTGNSVAKIGVDFEEIHENFEQNSQYEKKESLLKISISDSTWRVSESAGASTAQFFFFGNYVIKEVFEEEFKFLTETYLPEYEKYIMSNKDSLLPRFMMAFVVRSTFKFGFCKRYVLMNNVFPTPIRIPKIYDIKGSSINRNKKVLFETEILRDNDIVEKLIICEPSRRELLIQQLSSDTKFLKDLNITDYSLLIGILTEIVPETISSFSDESDGVRCIKSRIIYENTYYFGIIDVLQTFNVKKMIERMLKGVIYDKSKISIMPPSEFAERFILSINKIF